MAESIKQHMVRQRVMYLFFMLVGTIALGLYLSLFQPFQTQAAVSSVGVTDNDTANYGITGADISLQATVSGETPAGFQALGVFIAPSSSVITAENYNSTGCEGAPCKSLKMYPAYQSINETLPSAISFNSGGNAFVSGTQYVAWIMTVANVVELVSSSPFTFSPDLDVPDNQAPFVMHMNAVKTVENTTAYLYANIFDDQTTFAQFADTGDGRNEYVRAVVWDESDGVGSATTVTGTPFANAFFEFGISSSIVGAAGNSVNYYLVATDHAGNTRYFCNSSSAASAGDCQAAPFKIVVVAAGARTISGVVKDMDVNQAYGNGAAVFIGGFGHRAVTTTANTGEYQFSSIPDNSQVEIFASAQNYCPNSRFESVSTANLTDIDISIKLGLCGGGGEGGSGDAPFVTFSGPQDNSSFIPITERIRVGVSQPMQASSIDGSGTGNVYLTPDDGATKIAGTVKYCANQASSGCDWIPSQDQQVITFTPSSNLSTSTKYTLVIKENVLAENGKSISGNRPGGGHTLTFTTQGDTVNFGDGGPTFGDGGQYMPPFVRSMQPAPGQKAALDTNILLEFNEPLNSGTLTNAITLYNITDNQSVSAVVTLDNNEKRYVTINPDDNLTTGKEYEVRVLGAVANVSGVTMRRPEETAQVAFSSSFKADSSVSGASPTISPKYSNNATGVPVNTIFEFGFNKPMDVTTINSANISLKRGSTAVSLESHFDPASNLLSVMPINVLLPNTVYTITLSTSVKTLTGAAISETTFTYTTGDADTQVPTVLETRCDDFTCRVAFNERMNTKASTDITGFTKSVLNHENFILSHGMSQDVVQSSAFFEYDPKANAVLIRNLQLTPGETFSMTVTSTAADVSDNSLGSSLTLNGTVESSSQTFGFGDDGGMFGPPKPAFFGDGGQVGGGEFKPEGFGGFTGEQFAMGQADMAFPFNPTAGQDSNVFQVRFNPGVAVANANVIRLTFPNGTDTSGAMSDTYSPFINDLNGLGTANGTVTIASVDASVARQVDITLGVSGTTTSTDTYTIDLRRIINPSIPKDLSTGGYTVGLKLLQSGTAVASKTSVPYFIKSAGSNSITVRVYAGSVDSPDNVSGSLFLYGGGPSGPMDKLLTLSAGAVAQVNGSNATSVQYTNLSDGCYFVGTEPYIRLGSTDYYGQKTFEPICVSGSQSATKNIILTSSDSTDTIDVTVKIQGVNFNGRDIDVFAGGPGNFVVKTLSAVGDTSVTPTSTVLKLPSNGNWFIGVGPAMEKSASSQTAKPKALAGVPPAPVNMLVSNLGQVGEDITTGFGQLPQGVSFDGATNALTFTFTSANVSVSGSVKDNSGNAIQNAEVMLHRNGFGQPVFTQSDSNGNFTLNVAQTGNYEIGAYKEGFPSVNKQIEIRQSGESTAVYMNGQQITGQNPLVLKMKKADYYIAGKVLDANNNAIQYAPVFAVDANGNTTFGQSGSDGSYTIFVANGTYSLRSELPPDKSDACGTLSLTGVTVSGANKTNQNITPTASSCVTLSGSVSVGGNGLSNVPLFIEEWNTDSNAPVAGGVKRPASTDSSGAYSAKVVDGKTYRVGTWHPDYGELGATVVVSGNTTGNVTVASLSTVTVSFTGSDDLSSMNAFLEIKKGDDTTKRIGKQLSNLSSNSTVSVPGNGTYNYFVDVFGVMKATGTVSVADGTGTITVDLGNSSLVTVTGTIKDASNTALAGALVTFTNDDTGVVQTALTNSSGEYSVSIKAGDYKVGSSLNGYVAGDAATSTSFSADTSAFDFASGEDREPLTVANRVISGTIKDYGNATTSEGYVWATNATTGVVVKTALDSDGTYELPVTDGSWVVGAAAPLNDVTTSSQAVVVSGSNATQNITLTEPANVANKMTTSTSGIVAGNTGGSVNDSEGSGIKVTAGAGVLQTGSGNVTLNLERSYTAPDSEQFTPLANATFDITATGNSTIKNLNGNVEIQISYDDIVSDLPANVNESDLKLMYYSPETGDYIPVEGGFTVDPANNTISGQVDHFTEFVVAYVPSASVAGNNGGGDGGNNGGNNGGGGGGGGGSSSITPPTVPSVPPTTEAITIDQVYEVNSSTPVQFGSVVHTITVVAATDAEATIVIASTPVTTTLQKGETKEVDTNADGYASLQVTYYGLDESGKAKLNIITIADEGERAGPLTINDGQYGTVTTSVTLFMKATGATHMMISHSPKFTGAKYVPYTATTTWTLTSGDGEKTVYVRFKSASGGTVDVKDTIQLYGQGFDQKPIETPTSTKDQVETPEKATVSCPLTIGKAYKSANSPAVFYVTAPFGGGDTCTKRPFSRSAVFFTYFSSWSQVQVVSKDVLQSIKTDGLGFMPWGPKFNPQYGALIKSVHDPKVYLLINGEKRWIESEEAFQHIGYSWDWVEDVDQALLQSYPTGSTITSESGLPSGLLIKYSGSPKVYLLSDDSLVIGKQVKRHIVSESVFLGLGYRWDRIVTVPTSVEFADGSVLSSGLGVKKTENSSGTQTPAPVSSYIFTQYLSAGMTGEEVKQLQLVLKAQGFLSSGVNPTGYYGPATTEAVKKFQAAKGIQPLGVVGPSTRAVLNTL